jgi:KaiC/GvpD/RAD55 family RecA-like ATPase
MALSFQPASKKRSRARVALVGPSGSGKTYTALRIATGIGGKVALIDTERGSASKYADRFKFDVLELESFDPRKYTEAILTAGEAGYEVLIIDSLSHAWEGKDGALELVDKAADRSKAKNSFAAWKEVTPVHHQMVDAILRSKCHIIATMRVKTEWLVENVNGKQTPRKVGLAPVQRQGMEYEFDVVGDLDEAKLVVTKSRCPALTKAVVTEPGEDFGATLKAWLTDGVEAPEPQREPRPTTGLSDVNRARVARLWDQAKTCGLDKAAYQIWCNGVVGRAVPSVEWTDDDLDHLETALHEVVATRTGGAPA